MKFKLLTIHTYDIQTNCVKTAPVHTVQLGP